MLILLGFGAFQLLAAALSLLFWLLAGAWQPYIALIALISLILTLPSVQAFRKHHRWN